MEPPLAEGDYCAHAAAVLLAQVLAGTRPLRHLCGELRGRCSSQGPHTCSCLRHFHHKAFTLPVPVLCRFFGAHRARLAGGLAEYARCCVGTGALAALSVYGALPDDVLAVLCGYKGVHPAAAFESVMHLLPRRAVVLARTVDTSVADATAAVGIRSYKRWLTDSEAPAEPACWQGHINDTIHTVLSAHCLPAEVTTRVAAFAAGRWH